MRLFHPYLALGLLMAAKQWQLVSASVTVSVQLINYENPTGKKADGNCCDGISIFCSGKCDTVFLICLDHQHSTISSINHCPFGHHLTGVTNEQNNIEFGSSIGGTPNPHLFQLETWPGGMLMKAEISDKDSESVDELIEEFRHPFSQPADGNERSRVINGRTKLNFRVKVSCDPDYYTQDCSKLCTPPTSEDHYICDTVTGNKICAEDYYGSDCLVYCFAAENATYTCDPITGDKICISDYYGSNCSVYCFADENATYTCDPITGEEICIPDYYGRNCSVYCIVTLDSHHECHNITGGKICNRGWEGPDCDYYRNPCSQSPCVNRAQCIGDPTYGNYTCICEDGYVGVDCERKEVCEDDPCRGPADCFNVTGGVFHCFCDDGWTGSRCESTYSICAIDEPCIHGTCNETRSPTSADYSCICDPGWTEFDCHLDIDECEYNPCNDSHECRNTPGSYDCYCSNGGVGENCTITTMPPTTPRLEATMTHGTVSNPCAKDPCKNGGECWVSSGTGDAVCTCTEKYSGQFCQNRNDEGGGGKLLGVEYEAIRGARRLDEAISIATARYITANADDVTLNQDDVDTVITFFDCKKYKERETRRVMSVEVTVRDKRVSDEALQGILREVPGTRAVDVVKDSVTASCHVTADSGQPDYGEATATDETWDWSIVYLLLTLTVICLLILFIGCIIYLSRRRRKKMKKASDGPL